LKSTSKQEDIRTNGDFYFNHIIGCPQKNGEYMKEGDMLPPMSELDAIPSTDELLDETKAILDENIKPFFNKAIHKREVVDKLKSKQDEIRELLKKKVKFIEDDNEESDNDADDNGDNEDNEPA